MDFTFLEPGELVEGDLRLLLVESGFKPATHPLFPYYRFEMRNALTDATMGRITLRIGNGETVLRFPGHLGFEVAPEFRGNRYAARSVQLLLPFMRKHGLDRVWLGCSPENLASRKTCERVGGRYRDTIPISEDSDLYLQGMRFLRRYCIDIGAS